MAHGHKLRGGGIVRENQVLGGGGQIEKYWDNCNSIINKIY